MRLPYYQIDAFAERSFAGNPAGVGLLDAWLDDAALQAIAEENNLSETAFLVGGHGVYELRWFTPAAMRACDAGVGLYYFRASRTRLRTRRF